MFSSFSNFNAMHLSFFIEAISHKLIQQSQSPAQNKASYSCNKLNTKITLCWY